MTIHIGKLIKEELYRQEMPVIVFAKRIGRSRNGVYDLFERHSIDMELLTKIGAVLKYDFLALYDQQKQKGSAGFPAMDQAYKQQLFDLLEEKVKVLEMELQLLKRELALFKTAHK